ncbi:MAG: ABC transporter substrate-binding protein [Clostridiales bacterium]|nr:ABC transporter substrate-binding protein [Clostridiales bacterium]
MKKMLAALLAALMVLSLAACGASSAPAATTAPAATEAAAPAATEAATEAAAPAKTYTIGICQLVQHPALDAATQGFKDALTAKLGDAVVFDEQNAQGDSATCSVITTGFVSNQYDLIMANATPALLAAVSATDTIPILGTSVTDFASALAVDAAADGSLGMNVSGTSDGVPAQLYADCVMELVPDAKKVSVLYCSAEPNSVLQADQFIACMDAIGVATEVFTFSDSNDIQSVTATAVEGADALYIPTDNTAASNMTIVSGVCEPAGIPVICGEEGMCSGGGLATVSISYYDIGTACGEMAYDILVNGADISKIPVGYSQNPVKKYNADYAAAINFTLPEGYEAITE